MGMHVPGCETVCARLCVSEGGVEGVRGRGRLPARSSPAQGGGGGARGRAGPFRSSPSSRMRRRGERSPSRTKPSGAGQAPQPLFGRRGQRLGSACAGSGRHREAAAPHCSANLLPTELRRRGARHAQPPSRAGARDSLPCAGMLQAACGKSPGHCPWRHLLPATLPRWVSCDFNPQSRTHMAGGPRAKQRPEKAN